jgi:hypothetical protein
VNTSAGIRSWLGATDPPPLKRLTKTSGVERSPVRSRYTSVCLILSTCPLDGTRDTGGWHHPRPRKEKGKGKTLASQLT